MKEQERLESIKNDEKLYSLLDRTTWFKDIKWLIQQAEEKQNLEGENSHLIKVWDKKYSRIRKESHEMEQQLMQERDTALVANEGLAKRINQLERKLEDATIANHNYVMNYKNIEQQNKRYEEALRFYENEDNYEFAPIVIDWEIEIESEIFDDGGNKAKQALQNK